MRRAKTTDCPHQTLAGFSPSTLTAASSEPIGDDVVGLIYRMRWVPVALMALISLAPNFGWG